MDMVKDLFDSNQQIIKTLKSCMESAESASDEVTIDMMIGRLTVHEKASWMLRSILPKGMREQVKAPANYAA